MDLVTASVHLEYEVRLLRSTAQLLEAGSFSDREAESAIIEAVVIHAGVLLHFFFPARPKADDVLAEHFFDPPETWVNLRGSMPDVLSSLRHRRNKQIAHLTYARNRFPREELLWDIGGIHRALEALVNVFLDNVDPFSICQPWSRYRPAD